MMLLKLVQEANRELLASLASTEPHLVEVSLVAEILCDGDGQVQVEYAMPPVAWNEDGFTRVLHTFDDDREAIRSLWALLCL